MSEKFPDFHDICFSKTWNQYYIFSHAYMRCNANEHQFLTATLWMEAELEKKQKQYWEMNIEVEAVLKRMKTENGEMKENFVYCP